MGREIQTTTQAAIQALIQADASIDALEKARLIRTLFSTVADQTEQEERQERIIRRKDVAERLAVSPRMVDIWGKNGILNRVTIGTQSRATGYRESEVQALIAGRSN